MIYCLIHFPFFIHVHCTSLFSDDYFQLKETFFSLLRQTNYRCFENSRSVYNKKVIILGAIKKNLKRSNIKIVKNITKTIIE